MIEIIEPEPKLLLRIYADAIRQYYNSHVIKPDFDVAKKEFGYSTDPTRKIEKRYTTFKDYKELNKFLRETKPFFVSYSVADWMYPTRQNVEDKTHLSSELVFDFDDDEFLTYAQSDIIVCGDEYYTVKSALVRGINPLMCQDGSPATIIPIPSQERFRAVIRETKRLINILKREFGITEEQISVNYSGKRGVHVHVKADLFDGMDAEEAKEARLRIVDYLMLSSLNFDLTFTTNNDVIHGPTPDVGGKVGELLQKLINKLKIGKNAAFLTESVTDTSLRNKVINYIARTGIDNIVKNLEDGIYGPSFMLPVWKVALVKLAREMSLPLDPHTTIDINRLIRLPNSIHGTTGLIAKTIPIDRLDDFDPFTDAVGLSKKPSVKLKIKYLPQFDFGGETYGPFEDEEVTLPFRVAAYIIGVFNAWEVREDGS